MVEDLRAAGMEACDAAGRRRDFHALRHACGTMLARRGAPIAVTQKIMRHSSPNLTMAYYSHTDVREQAVALNKLPSLVGAGVGEE